VKFVSRTMIVSRDSVPIRTRYSSIFIFSESVHRQSPLTCSRKKRRALESLTGKDASNATSPLQPTNQRCWFQASNESACNAGISYRLSPYEAFRGHLSHFKAVPITLTVHRHFVDLSRVILLDIPQGSDVSMLDKADGDTFPPETS